MCVHAFIPIKYLSIMFKCLFWFYFFDWTYNILLLSCQCRIIRNILYTRADVKRVTIKTIVYAFIRGRVLEIKSKLLRVGDRIHRCLPIYILYYIWMRTCVDSFPARMVYLYLYIYICDINWKAVRAFCRRIYRRE